MILCGEPEYLIKECLKKKLQIQKEASQTQLQLRMRIGFIQELNCVRVEPTSLKGLSTKEGKTGSHIQLYLYTDKALKEEDGMKKYAMKKSPEYTDFQESVAFDMVEGD